MMLTRFSKKMHSFRVKKTIKRNFHETCCYKCGELGHGHVSQKKNSEINQKKKNDKSKNTNSGFCATHMANSNED